MILVIKIEFRTNFTQQFRQCLENVSVSKKTFHDKKVLNDWKTLPCFPLRNLIDIQYAMYLLTLIT